MPVQPLWAVSYSDGFLEKQLFINYLLLKDFKSIKVDDRKETKQILAKIIYCFIGCNQENWSPYNLNIISNKF